MAKEKSEGFEWSSPEPLSDKEGRGLPVTNTSTPIPDVKPPKQSDNSSGGNKKEE